MKDALEIAAALLAKAGSQQQTTATAESLTGGLVGQVLTAAPGSSSTYRGGVIVYATELKAKLIGVDSELLDQVGAVDPEVAAQMARGVAQLCDSDIGIATTGVAGPDPQDGHEPGLVYIAVFDRSSDRTEVRKLQLAGDRDAIRLQTCQEALSLALDVL